MKPIEERAKEYSISSYPNMQDMQFACEMHFEAGAEWMREMAIKAHRACCPLNELQCIHRDRDDYSCTYVCRYVWSFIQKLSK